ncbi:hypothetical protein [Mammaliicoccus sciuri]|uniref:hypothetical protein n=1 Tax=Mammaliicoccus sciuri TaxID=1296 RepID=UPI002B25F0D7|nr:hypothetical protein [Mammaliicoccus sciuri]WQK75193.1 hypothetical protein P3U33_05545 [Mammaliicoccus sciuri]
MTKVNLTIQVELDENKLKENGVIIEEILNQLTFVEDEVLDGYVLTRNSNDNTDEFYIKNVDIK